MDISGRSVSETDVAGNIPLASAKRRQRTMEEKRRIVEEMLTEGASVARVARAHGVNANQVFRWRRLYHAGRLGGSGAVKRLPVRVSEGSIPPMTCPSDERSSRLPGTIHIELRHAPVRIVGSADPALLRVLMECLQR